MRIGVNMISLAPGQAGGVAIYLLNVLRVLQRSQSNEQAIVFVRGGPRRLSEVELEPLFGPRPSGQRGRGYGAGFPTALRRVWGRLPDPVRQGVKRLVRDQALRRRIRTAGVDVWFCPQGVLDPPAPGIPAVALLPDAQHEFYPEFFPAWELRIRRREYARTCRDAAAVITLSEHAKATLVRCYGASPARVVVIPLAPGPEYLEPASAEAVEQVCRRYGLEPGYLFYPANTWKHKNHATLVDALARLRDRTGRTPRCVLVGWEHAGEPALREAVALRGLQREVIRLGYVPNEDMPALYRAAGALVFPSLFEGFGLPLLEAMAQGCPVACAKATSIPEVVGDAAVLFDPRRPEDIADAITCVLQTGERRQELVARGLARAARFNWTRVVSQTLAVFQHALGPHSLVRT